LNKEHGNAERYVQKGYRSGFDKNKGPWLGKYAESETSEDFRSMQMKQMPASFPAPFLRMN